MLVSLLDFNELTTKLVIFHSTGSNRQSNFFHPIESFETASLETWSHKTEKIELAYYPKAIFVHFCLNVTF